MATQQEIQKQLQALVRQVRADSDRENEQRNQALKVAEERNAGRAEAARDQFLRVGLSENDLEADVGSASEQQRDIAALTQKLSQSTPSSDLDLSRINIPMATTESVQVVSPLFSSVLSSPIAQTDAIADAPASDWYYNNVEQNPWAWAQGAGWWDEASTSIEVDFWYYFVPSTYRFYGINPYTTYRGFYIVKSDDKWYTSEYARVVLSNHVNVYQYTWKGWDSINLLDVGGDNINVSSRFDDTRNHYYSALLAAGDGTWILNRVRLYVYARGGSAYSKLDFGTGTGNYIVAPYVYVS
jgi:hypothetical protein